MLVEEERNSSNLRALLQVTRDRLETETRRADAAESRATIAEARVREGTSRAVAAEQAQHRSELETARAQEETKRVQMQTETAERELRRVTNELQRLTRQKEEAEAAAAKARDLARKYQSALRDYQAHEEGRQEGIRLALLRRYDDGREDGWEEGRNEGWDAGREEGFHEGRKAGFEEGHEMGRREERRYAGQLYDRWKEAPSSRHFDEVEAVIPDRSLFSKGGRSEVRVGARRKGPKSLPTLPLSAFSPPNTGVSDNFPLPPSPSTVHPDSVIDASVRDSIPEWKKQTAGSLDGRVSAVVVKASEGDLEGYAYGMPPISPGVSVLAASIPLDLERGTIPNIPSTKFRIAFTASFTSTSDAAVATLQAALKACHVIDIDVQDSGEEGWEKLEDLLTKATAEASNTGYIILSNVLPPPHDLVLPIVKLLTHPTYQSYQSQIAALSLIPRVYLSYVPPTWNAPTPPTPVPGQEAPTASKEQKEWKRRIKMYLGPAVEAFGFERIIFGSAPSPISHAPSNASDWYEIARESFAELGVDQESVDAVFCGNAKRVYATSN
ncbi:hypothetical protein H4582DRAFT_1809587 [Lactarius indigo]|nr:hypothetical protein H4582DRAFT_1809587 [Lactarius indigo]